MGTKQLALQDWSELAKLSMHSYTDVLSIRFYTICLTKPKWE